ncbi:MAG: response regulator transcription factor [Firmicutes bacterium]|nr:response regulator transcription factor [Bacillota bacterium]
MAVVAICDEDPKEIAYTTEVIDEYNLTKPVRDQVIVRAFPSARNLWFEMVDANVADIFILDINMPEMNGLELAHRIHQLNSRALVIFLDSHIEYADDSYKVDAFRFILKSEREEHLPEALDAAQIRLKEDRSQYVGFRQDGEIVRVAFDEIIYAEKVDRKLLVHTLRQGNIYSNEPLAKLYERLNSRRFYYADQSYFVNIDHILKLGTHTVYLIGSKLPLQVSRRMWPALKAAVLKEWHIT